MNADTSSVITASMAALTDKNLFSYCDSNPVMRVDTSGMYWDTILDVISVIFSYVDYVNDKDDPVKKAALAIDVICLVVPIAVAGGTMYKIAKTVATKTDVPVNIARGVKLVDACDTIDNVAVDSVVKADFIVTPNGVAMDTAKNYNLVGSGKSGDWFQIHNYGKAEKGVGFSHTHMPQMNTNGVNVSYKRVLFPTKAEDIDYADMLLRKK